MDENEHCYWKMVQSYASHVLKHYHGDDASPKGEPPLEDTFIPPNTYWTSDEKHRLFHHLKRFSRLRLDLVADAMATKTLAEVSAYVGHLDGVIHRNSYEYQRKENPPPAAMEVSDGWIEFEEHMSKLILQREALTEHLEIVAARRQACNDAGVKAQYCEVGAVVEEYSIKKKRNRNSEEEQTPPSKKRALEHTWLREDLFRELDDIRLKVFDNMLDVHYESGPPTSSALIANAPYDGDDNDGSASAAPEPMVQLSDAGSDSEGPEDTSSVDGLDVQQSPDRSITDSGAPDHGIPFIDTVAGSHHITVIKHLAEEANFAVEDLVKDDIDVFFLSRLGNLLRMYMSIPDATSGFPVPRCHNPNYLTPPNKPTISYSTLKQLSGHLRQFLRMIIQRAIILAETDYQSRVHPLPANEILKDHVRKSLAIFTRTGRLPPRIGFIRALPVRLNAKIRDLQGRLRYPLYPKPKLFAPTLKPELIFNTCVEVTGPSISTPIAYRRPNWAPEFEGRKHEAEEDEYLRTSFKATEDSDNLESILLPRKLEPDEDERLGRELLEEEEQDMEDAVTDLVYEHKLWEHYDADDWRFKTYMQPWLLGDDDDEYPAYA